MNTSNSCVVLQACGGYNSFITKECTKPCPSKLCLWFMGLIIYCCVKLTFSTGFVKMIMLRDG